MPLRAWLDTLPKIAEFGEGLFYDATLMEKLTGVFVLAMLLHGELRLARSTVNSVWTKFYITGIA